MKAAPTITPNKALALAAELKKFLIEKGLAEYYEYNEKYRNGELKFLTFTDISIKVNK